MKIGEIDYNKKAPKKSLFLCKPNKQTIAKINEAHDIQYYTKLGTVNELSFKIPTIIIKDDVPMENPNIDRIKNRYIFKLVVGNTVEYFLYNDGTKNYGEDEYIEYKAYSLGSQLSDKNVREFHSIGNLREILDELLVNIYGEEDYVTTRWRIDYVDSYFLLGDYESREYEVSSMSALEVIYDITEKWNAVIKWNTVDHTISFYKAENVGLNKGFYIRDGKYLENFNLQTDSSSTITRVKAFGADSLNLAGINPTGQYYIEDYTFYMYPFEYDESTGKVIKSSDYMSDELCIALYKYNKLLKDNDSQFKNHVSTINSISKTLSQENGTLQDRLREVTRLENKRDLLLAEFQKDKSAWGTNGFNDRGTKEGTTEHVSVLRELDEARARLSAQQTIVDNVQGQLNDSEGDKVNYLSSLSHTKHFSPSQWSELQQFIIEKEYKNDSITDAYELLEEAKIILKQNQEPAIKLTVNIIDFLSVVECQNDWDKLGLGDTIRIRYDRLKVNIQAKIIEINYNFEDFSITLTIANEKDLKDGTDKLMDLLNKADITSTIVSMDKNGWNLSKENNGKINDLINNKWDSLKQAVLAGYEQSISISERGIIVKSLDDPNSWLVIQNGFLAITNDNGSSWKHAISKDGIWGEYIFGKVISGVNLLIEDESGIWKTQGSRTTIYDRTGKETMWLGLVSDNARDQFDNILESDQECFGLKSWNDHTKVEMSTCVGIAISKWKDDDWKKVFWADGSGTLYTDGLVTKNIKIVNDLDELILDAESNFFDIGKLQNIVADGKLTTLEKLQIATQLYEIHTDYKNTLAQAEKYNKSDRDITYNLESQWTEEGFPIASVENKSHCDPTNLIKSYTALLNYISQYIPVVKKGVSTNETLEIDFDDILMETTSEIDNRGYFIQVFRDYYDESARLKQAIEDSLFYSGINMGKYYNNLMMGKQGFVAVRNDGKYRAYLNATNGLALEKWEDDRWVKKLYASIGSDEYEDGTLIAEELVAKKLRIETKFNEVLLDSDSLNLDFSVLESIVVDDVIVSIEKETLKVEWDSITGQYNELISELDRYANEVYSDRDGTYLGLDTAKKRLIDAKDSLVNAYSSLKSILDIVFADMTSNTYLSTDLGIDRNQFVALYRKLYSAFEYARSSLKNFLEKSSLQLGRNYNNTIIDAENGVTVYRGDMVNMTRLNATDGISISKNNGTYDKPIWEKLFWVDMQGWLHTEGMRANNLMVFGGQNKDLILDANTGLLDFTQLDDILYDDIIISSEKATLFSMLSQATAQYNQIISQYSTFRNTPYTSQYELEPSEVTAMKIILSNSKNELNTAHSKLSSVMATVLHNVNKTTRISSDLSGHGISTREAFKAVWANYYDKYDALRNALENYLGASSLQLGKNYNNVVIDENGVSVYGVSSKEGGTVNSTLQMNATVGISLTVEGENRLWLGADGLIYAKKLRIMGDDDEGMIEDVDGSYISDLTVNRLKTLGKSDSTQDIVHIEKNFIRFNTWYGDVEKTKLEITYNGTGASSYPEMKFGAGNGSGYGSGSEVAKIYKDNKKFAIEYDAPNGKMTKFYFNETDTDNEGQAVYFESKGGIRFHSENKFVAKTANDQYMRVIKDTDAVMKFGDVIVRLNSSGLLLQFNSSNYIEINPNGVTVKGNKINLN